MNEKTMNNIMAGASGLLGVMCFICGCFGAWHAFGLAALCGLLARSIKTA